MDWFALCGVFDVPISLAAGPSSESQRLNRTSTKDRLVSLCFRRSHSSVLQREANVGSGTLEMLSIALVGGVTTIAVLVMASRPRGG